jgi:hypothetical protein
MASTATKKSQPRKPAKRESGNKRAVREKRGTVSYPAKILGAVEASRKLRKVEVGSGPVQHTRIREVVQAQLNGAELTKNAIVKLAGATSLAQLTRMATGEESSSPIRDLAAKMPNDGGCRGKPLAGALVAWIEAL